MTHKDRLRYDDLLDQADRCRTQAEVSLNAGSSVGFREWIEASDAARRAANTIKFPVGESS